VKTTLDFGKYVLKHEAFKSGNFDTNFVKHYFQDPRVMYDHMTEEEEALKHGINTIWDDLKERKASEYASKKIDGAWQITRS
jgi:propionyl-CoA carboxylase alpha chain